MRYGWMAAAVVVGLWIGIVLSGEPAGQETTNISYEEYEGKNVGPDEAKRKLLKQPIMLRDIYQEDVKLFPTFLTRANYTPQRYVGFRTQAGYGSDMLCLVPRTDKESVEELGKTLGSGKILMSGHINQIGPGYVFIADEVVRGWMPKPKPKSLMLTVSTPDSPQKRTFRLSEPGKTYRIPSPYDGRPIYITYQVQ